ncbi:hypothetical protein [Sphingopyxis sp. P8]|uniref:hypothetical protein n=1 Tax=Sphingopyxis sp. P8 TaxID=2763256 RepID=UPI001D0B5860|nr:hypothetical protein [Sphingopyxis sp. P8]
MRLAARLPPAAGFLAARNNIEDQGRCAVSQRPFYLVEINGWSQIAEHAPVGPVDRM